LFPQLQVILLHPSSFKKALLHLLHLLINASVIASSTACFADNVLSFCLFPTYSKKGFQCTTLRYTLTSQGIMTFDATIAATMDTALWIRTSEDRICGIVHDSDERTEWTFHEILDTGLYQCHSKDESTSRILFSVRSFSKLAKNLGFRNRRNSLSEKCAVHSAPVLMHLTSDLRLISEVPDNVLSLAKFRLGIQFCAAKAYSVRACRI
jgi:hypothetical protein